MTKYERDPELANFLSKVEDLDSKRYNNVSTLKSTREPLSPVRSHTSGNCRRADIMTGKNIEDRESLAYRSAYNYEMTFSPKKTHYSLNELDLERVTPTQNSKKSACRNEKKFVISEEDYLLLQKLKGSQSRNDFGFDKTLPSSERGHRTPSRGQPRLKEKEIVSIQYDFDFQERVDKSPTSSSPPPPPLPTRNNHIEIIEDGDEEKPLLPTRPTKAGIIERPLPTPKKSEVVTPERVKPAPPVPRCTKPAS